MGICSDLTSRCTALGGRGESECGYSRLLFASLQLFIAKPTAATTAGHPLIRFEWDVCRGQ